MKSLRQRANHLRRLGWSYNIISQKLGISKSTLSDWLREVPYEPNQTVLRRIRTGPAKAAASKQRVRLGEITFLKKQGLQEIGNISRRDLLFLGLGIYLGEGSKLYETVRVINSDPQIIRLAMRWFLKICGVPDQNFAVAIHLYPDTSQGSAIRYWSRVIDVPRKQFEKIQIDRRLDKSLKKKRRLPYGTAHVKIRSCGNKRFGVTLHRRIMGWVDAVYKKTRA